MLETISTMKGSKIIGLILIAAAAILLYVGLNNLAESSQSVSALGVELSATDNGKKTSGTLMSIAGGLFFFAGAYFMFKPGK